MGEFLMPSLGADMEAGTLVEWKIRPGERVKRGDIVADIETDKGLIEVEIFEDGVVVELLVSQGTRVPVGAPLAVIRSEGAPVAAAAVTAVPPPPVAAPPPGPPGAPPVPPPSAKSDRSHVVL